MRNQLLVVIAILLLISLVEAKPGAVPSAKAPVTRLALIDMAVLFKKSDEFKSRRQKLKDEIKVSDMESKAKLAQLQAYQSELKVTKPGTAEAKELQGLLVAASSDYKADRQKMQVEFLEKESVIYQEVYLTVKKMAEKIAEKHGITLVLRYNR